MRIVATFIAWLVILLLTLPVALLMHSYFHAEFWEGVVWATGGMIAGNVAATVWNAWE